MSQEQTDGEHSMAKTKVGPVDDGTAETEVNVRLVRGSDLGPEGAQKDIPIVTGVFGDTPNPGRPRRLGPWAGPNRNGPRMSFPPH